MSVILLVIDGLGIYNQKELSTFHNLKRKFCIEPCKDFPTLWKLGFDNAYIGAGNIMMQRSNGVGSLEGHREMLGHISFEKYDILNDGIPDGILEIIEKKCKIKCLGNLQGRGKNILPNYWKYLESSKIILYTGQDSTISIAYEASLCDKDTVVYFAKQLMGLLKSNGIYIRKIIIRQYVGNWNNKAEETDLFHYVNFDNVLGPIFNNIFVNTKIDNIFSLSTSINYPTQNDDNVFEVLSNHFIHQDKTLYFFNLGDFDYYAHRGESQNCFIALKKIDQNIARICETLGSSDTLIITSDHGVQFRKSNLSSSHVKVGTLFLFLHKNKRCTIPGIFEGHDLVIRTLETISHNYVD